MEKKELSRLFHHAMMDEEYPVDIVQLIISRWVERIQRAIDEEHAAHEELIINGNPQIAPPRGVLVVE